MDTYWVPGVNGLGTFGRWGFAEFGDVYTMQDDFAAQIESGFNDMVCRSSPSAEDDATAWLARAGGTAPNLEPIPRRKSEVTE